MKIPLNFNKDLNLLTIQALITIPNARITLRPIEFLIDTGSNISFLDENDMIDFKLVISYLHPAINSHTSS